MGLKGEELRKLQEKGIRKSFYETWKKNKKLNVILVERLKELEEVKKKIKKLEEEIEILKKELSHLKQIPNWVKPNKDTANLESKKLGPQKGHLAHKRKAFEEEEIDEEIVLEPKQCPDCQNSGFKQNLRKNTKIH